MDERGNILRRMKICRFCLSEDEPLTNIYEKDGKQSVPLPLQIMACVAIEVFANDGMPQLICRSCRRLTQEAYNFKTTCKKSDDALKLYLATGNLIKPSQKKRTLSSDDHIDGKFKIQHVEREQSTSKKKRILEPEVVTINFTAPLELSKPDDNEQNPLSCKVEGNMAGDDAIQELVDEGLLQVQSYEEHELDEEDDDTINPVLKVPQVETDVFPCSQCERSFPLKQLLDIHLRNHERERSFTCEDCGRKFFTKYDLGKHLQTHTDIKPFGCVVCRKTFSRESLLHRHEKVHVNVPKYLCGFCDRTFLTREDLDSHCEKHKKKRPFACRLCNKSFVFKQGLERHELTHADQKPHKCNYCEASFTSPIKLTRHITSHAGLRPYPCKLCGRTFLLSHHLTRHMRSHYAAKSSNVLPVGQHKCDVCSMSFRRKDSLINHSAIHSMVNLKCVICNTAFDNAKKVKEHITTHLSGLPYPCDRCDYSFNTQYQLEEHELKHAEMEYEDQIEKEVTMEVQQARQQEEDDEDLDEEEEEFNSADEEEDEVAEFTITNPDNPEVVRRSKRPTKIKNYAQFLKDELGSDIEDEVIEQGQNDGEEESETIKPVVRSEGTKVYTRKNMSERPKIIPIIKPAEMDMTSLDEITQPQLANALENLGLTKNTSNALPGKKFVDMKIGDKTVRVQKLMMTKAEIEAMAREGKIEMKGKTIFVKNNLTSFQSRPRETSEQSSTSKEDIFQSVAKNDGKNVDEKPTITKTFARKLSTQASSSTANNQQGEPSASKLTEDGECE